MSRHTILVESLKVVSCRFLSSFSSDFSTLFTIATMSLTVTSTALEKVLEDYRIVLTGSDTAPAQPSSSSTKAKANPPDWPTDNFRIPDYRPVNKNLDIEQRPNGSSFPEKAFLTIMFTGVFINAVSRLNLRSRP